jgi:hypothetical protein
MTANARGPETQSRKKAGSPVWVISGCAGAAAARQVNLNKRTSTPADLSEPNWRSATGRPDDNVLDLLS